MKEERKNKRNVPNLRFPGFEGEWEEKRLDKIASIERGRFSPRPRNNPIYYGGSIPFVQTSDVVNSNGKIDSYSQTLNEKGLSVSKLFPKGSILITIAANIGYAGVLQRDMACPDSLIGLKCKSEIYNWFLNILLEIHQPKMDYLAVAAAQKNINIEFLKPYSFNLPNLFEQKKIATLVSAINNRIQTQNEIIQRLESLMRGLQQRLFNQKIRFKTEQDVSFPKWNKSKLGKFLSIPLKESPIKIEITKILTVKLHLKGVLLNERTDGLKIGATKYIIRRKGQFIYGKQNLFNGALGIIPEEFDGFLSSGDVPSLDIDTKLINPMFLYYYLGRPTYYKKLEAVASGSGSKRIHETILLSHIISVPNLEEQNRIVSFLSKIDDKIQVEKQALEHLTNQKKYFMQQLFI